MRRARSAPGRRRRDDQGAAQENVRRPEDKDPAARTGRQRNRGGGVVRMSEEEREASVFEYVLFSCVGILLIALAMFGTYVFANHIAKVFHINNYDEYEKQILIITGLIYSSILTIFFKSILIFFRKLLGK
jgi:hypothetical protein